MQTHTLLRDHEQIFNILVQSLAVIDKTIDQDELIILYINNLSVETFGKWIQT